MAQVDQLAALRTKRAVPIADIPDDNLAALRAVNERFLHSHELKTCIVGPAARNKCSPDVCLLLSIGYIGGSVTATHF